MTLRPILTLKAILMSGIFFALQANAPDHPVNISEHQLAEAYIHEHISTAVDEMQRIGMPASVIIAQGMLESYFGQSDLAQTANNHFGIKCHRGWQGESYFSRTKEYVKEGFKTEKHCFRSYQNTKESYRDHSDFLISKENYRFLFLAQNFDYKYWANGLSKAHYATDPGYAKKLIEIVEQYNLAQYDKKTTKNLLLAENDSKVMNVRVQVLEKSLEKAYLSQIEILEMQAELKTEILALKSELQHCDKQLSSKIDDIDSRLNCQADYSASIQNDLSEVIHIQNKILNKETPIFPERHCNSVGVFYQNNLLAVAMKSGQSFADISSKTNINITDLRRFNDLKYGQELELPLGCFIYLEPKANLVAAERLPHTVQKGENIHLISQRYGIKLSKLKQRNHLKDGDEPAIGEFVFLNEQADFRPKLR